MEKTVMIDGREVRFRASAAIPRLYRLKFKRDIIQDMRDIDREIKKARSAAEKEDEAAAQDVTLSTLPLEALTLFENVAYVMAYHADPAGVGQSPDEWLDGFETFSIYQVFPVIKELWSHNMLQLNSPAKK